MAVDPQFFARQVTRAAAIKSQIKALEGEYAELLDTLGDLEVRNYPAGDYVLKVTPNRRFDEATASRGLSATLFNKILKKKPDSALAKAVLTPEQYALCQKDYGVKREIVPVEDAE